VTFLAVLKAITEGNGLLKAEQQLHIEMIFQWLTRSISSFRINICRESRIGQWTWPVPNTLESRLMMWQPHCLGASPSSTPPEGIDEVKNTNTKVELV